MRDVERPVEVLQSQVDIVNLAPESTYEGIVTLMLASEKHTCNLKAYCYFEKHQHTRFMT